MRLKFIGWVLLCTAASITSAGTVEAASQVDAGAGFPVARGGKAEAVIVLPAKPSATERYAAQELNDHLEKVAGVKLPVTSEDSLADVGARPRIYIGGTRSIQESLANNQFPLKPWQIWSIATEQARPTSSAFRDFPANGYVIKSAGNSLFLAGRDGAGDPLTDTVSAGTLFAVYEWLETELGVRWIWPGELGTKLPKLSTVVSGRWDRQHQPPLLSTKMRRTIGGTVFTPSEGGYSPEQRQKVMEEEAVWYRRNRFARSVNLDYGGHAFEGYWKRFGESNPEFFNLLPDGKRRPSINERVIGMSVANAGFQRQVVEDWKKNRTAERPWLNAVENDTSGLCTCPECLATDVRDPEVKDWDHRVENARRAFLAEDRLWYRPLGSMSDRYARYYLAVQKLARETDPQATVIAYAYLNYRNPPLATKLNSNIVIGIIPEAPDPRSYLWPLDEGTFEGFKRQWTGWSQAGAVLYLRPNYLISGHEQPVVFPHMIGRYFQLAYRNNLVATDYDSLTSMWGTQGPNLYIATRLHWEPEEPLEKILREYYDLFGPASNAVRAYFDFWEQRTAARGKELLRETQGPLKEQIQPLFLKWSNFYSVASSVFSEADYRKGEELLTVARKAAGGDPLTIQRVEFLQGALKDARLVAETSAVGAKLETTGDIDGMSRQVAELDQHRKEMARQYPQAVNLDMAAFNENRTWDRLIYNALAKGKSSRKLPVRWQLRWDPERQGKQGNWFGAERGSGSWESIEVTSAWEKQAPGRSWKQKAGADYDGWAWYKINFKAEPKYRGQRVSLLFGAADEAATVYLNGREVGSRPFERPDDWKTPFSVDVTESLRYDEENELTVLVEDKSGLGGLWKPVWLVEDGGKP